MISIKIPFQNIHWKPLMFRVLTELDGKFWLITRYYKYCWIGKPKTVEVKPWQISKTMANFKNHQVRLLSPELRAEIQEKHGAMTRVYEVFMSYFAMQLFKIECFFVRGFCWYRFMLIPSYSRMFHDISRSQVFQDVMVPILREW